MADTRDQGLAPQAWTPLQEIAKAALVAVFALILGFVVPAIAASVAGVYSAESMKETMRRGGPELKEALTRLKTFEEGRNRLKAQVARIDEAVQAPVNGQSSDVLLRLRQEYEKVMKISPPVSIQPFHLHILMYFWPIMYFSLGCLVFLLRPPKSAKFKVSSTNLRVTVVLSTGIFLFDIWPLCWRVLSSAGRTEGRIVYAYTNPDVSALCFAVQLANFLVFSILLALLWQQWAAAIVERQAVVRHERSNRKHGAIDVDAMHRLSRSLLHWQISFVTLSLGFVVYTAIFWNQIIRNGDWRFAFEAIVVHLLWLASAILLTAPVAIDWHVWQANKLSAITELINGRSPEGQDEGAKITAISDLQPIGYWNGAAAAVTVLTSFSAPLIQALVKLQ
jgi:hypothetical protein